MTKSIQKAVNDKQIWESDINRGIWLENSPVCTKIVDLDLNLHYMSASGVKELKIDDITDYYGKPYPLSFYPDSFKKTMFHSLLKVKETGNVLTQEDFVKDIKGNKIWYHSTLVPVTNEEQKIDSIMIVSANITKQKLVEETFKNALDHLESKNEKSTTELYKSEERFSLAMQGANDGLWDWNINTDEVYFSPRWKNMLGYEDNELENHLNTWASLVYEEDRDFVLEKVQDYVTGKTDSFEVEMHMHHKDGHEVVVLSRAFCVTRESDGKATRMVGTHIDITERKKSESFDEKNLKCPK